MTLHRKAGRKLNDLINNMSYYVSIYFSDQNSSVTAHLFKCDLDIMKNE